jgi:hypothetical protein
MQQRWLINLVLLIVVLILSLVVVYTLKQEEKAKAPLLPLTELKAETVKNIAIERQNTATIKLTKTELGKWQLTTPFDLPANNFRVERLLELLAERDYQKLDKTQVKLAELKLDSPLATVTFEQLRIAFGDASPMRDGKRYLLVDQQPYLISDTWFYTLSEEATQFVNLAPFGETPKIIELQLPDYHLIFQNNKWNLLAAATDTSNTGPDALNALIEQWQNLQAFNVSPNDDNGKNEGEVTVTVQGEAQPLHFIIRSIAPDFTLARPDKGVQYQLSGNQGNKLLKLPSKPQETAKSNTPPLANQPK